MELILSEKYDNLLGFFLTDQKMI